MENEQIELKSYSKKLKEIGNTSSIVSMVFIEFSPEIFEQSVKEVERAAGEIKIKTSLEANFSDGNNFIQPLQRILVFLQQLVHHRGQGGEILESIDEDEYIVQKIHREIRSLLHSLGTITFPNLIMHIKRINTNSEEMCCCILDCLSYLLALDQSATFCFPTLFATCLLYMCNHWTGAVDTILKYLCYYALPMVLLYPSECSIKPANHMSASAMLMLVLDNTSCGSKHHMMITDTLMRCKKDVCTDILTVVAYGTKLGRDNALKLLLHYWPVDVTIDRLNDSLTQPTCDFSTCSNSVDYLCLDTSCALKHNKNFSDDGKKKLFLLLCTKCNDSVHRNHTPHDHKLVKVMPPIRDIKPNCELRLSCFKGRAEVTCYGEGCASVHDGLFPVRMCMKCHMTQHTDLNDRSHMFQVCPQNPWSSRNPVATSILLEAMTKLLDEKPVKVDTKREGRRSSAYPGAMTTYQVTLDPISNVFMLLNTYFKPEQSIENSIHQEWFERILALVLEWLLTVHNILEEIMEDCTSNATPGLDNSHQGSLIINHPKTVQNVCINHQEIHKLVTSNIIPWLESVCNNVDIDCIATVFLPEGPPHVQVGDMWDANHDDIDRYRRTLSMLNLIMQNHFFTKEVTNQVYNEVMPHWMDLLFKLRSSPGQMEKLKDLLVKIFPEDKASHVEQLTKFDFIISKFRRKDSIEKQRALFWLQDLSRLDIKVPYTFHIFDEIFHKKGGGHHTARPSEADVAPMPLLRKESTGSFSGYESEPPLVSQLSEDGSHPSNTQAILNLNFSLSKYIVMLDIWSKQLRLCNTARGPSFLSFNAFQKFACCMLEKVWESNHATSDHIGSFNTCLFCQAYAMWFSIASHITSHYSEDSEDMTDGDQGSPGPPIHKKSRVHVSNPFRTSAKKKSVKVDIEEEETVLDHLQNIDAHQKQPSIKMTSSPRDRRTAVIGSHSQVKLDLNDCATPTEGTAKLSSTRDKEEKCLPQLYILFQQCIKKMDTHYHPDSLVQVVNYMQLLVCKCNVLKMGVEKDEMLEDIRALLKRLWKILEGNVSYLSQSCVVLMFLCLFDTIELEVASPSKIVKSELSTLIHSGLNQKKWRNVVKTVAKLFNIYQFMTEVHYRDGTGAQNLRARSHRYISLTMAIAFCKLTRLLHSKESIVVTKVQYCLTNLKNDAVEAIQDCLFLLFVHVPLYRFTVVQTLSLLSSAVPEAPFVSASLVRKILSAVEGLTRTKDPDELYRTSIANEPRPKRESNTSISSGRFASRPSTTSSAMSVPIIDEDFITPEVLQLKCDAACMLMRYIINTTDFSDFQTEIERPKRGTSNKLLNDSPEEYLVNKLEGLVCGPKFNIPPKTLCKMRMLEMFFIHGYKMLDRNYKFCETKSMIPFVLRVLGYCICPHQKDYPYIQNGLTTPSTGAISNDDPCSFTLSNLPNKLQASWLRVLFVTIYKYTKLIVDNPETVRYLQWCIEVVLNTLKCVPHVCPGHPVLQPANDSAKHIRYFDPESPTSPMVDSSSTSFIIGDMSGNASRTTRPSQQQGGLERNLLEPVPEELVSMSSSPQHSTTGDGSLSNTRPRVLHTNSIASFASSFTSGISFDQQAIIETQGRDQCQLCYTALEIYSEDVVALCVLCLGTCAHHTPDLVSTYLVTGIIPCISRVVIPGNFYWQESSPNDPPPGSGMSIAKQFLLTILTQFAERRMFIYLLRHNHDNELREVVFKAIATCLNVPIEEEKTEEEEEDDLTVASPLEYFLEDACNSAHFSYEVTSHSMMNISCYLEKIPDSMAHLFLKLNNLDVFLKKLHQPDLRKTLYAEETFQYFLKIIIQLLKFSIVSFNSKPSTTSQPILPATLSAIFQEFPDILLESLQLIYIPTGGLFSIIAEWFKAFHPFSHKRRDGFKKQAILKLLIEQFSLGLSSDSTLLPQNLTSLTQTFLLLLGEYVYLGYIDDLAPNKRVYTPSLRYEQEYINLNSIVTSDTDNTGIERLFTESMDEALKYLALRQPRTNDSGVIVQVKLTLAQLVACRISQGRHPENLLRRIASSQILFSWFANKSSTAVNNGSGKLKGLQNTSVSTFVNDTINSLQVIGWLLLGAMSLNVLHEAVVKTGEYGPLEGIITTECEVVYEVLVRMFSGCTEAVQCLLRHVMKAFDFLVEKTNYAYLALKSILCFSTICTVYLEFTYADSLPEITYFWQQLVDKVMELPSKKMLLCNEDIAGSFCEQTIIPLKRLEASCVSMLQPTWKRVFSLLQNLEEAKLPEYNRVEAVPRDLWIREMLRNFADLESQYKLTNNHH